MKFYHATNVSNTLKIIADGQINPGYDGVIYLCKKPEDCCKFAFIRGATSCNVLELELDECDVIETFDHSEAFFKCRCYGSTNPILTDNIVNIYEYERELQ